MPLMLVGRDPDMLGLLREVLIDAGFLVSAKLLDSFARNITSHEPASVLIYDESPGEADAERLWASLQDTGWARVPLVVLSEVFDGARVARCLDRGISEYITKPFDVDELAARVRKVLREQMTQERGGLVEPSEIQPEEGFSGDLAYMGLPDLLMNLHQNRRTGELTVSMDEGDYAFQFSRGELVNVTGPERIKGNKALYRAIRLFYGRFVFAPLEDAHAFERTNDYGPLPNLVLSAVQESDEYPITRNQLPPDPITVMLSPEASSEAFSQDLRLLRPLLKRPDLSYTIDDLVLASPKTDLQAASELLRLYNDAVLVLAD
jgi:DNA-binding response OmpR family regulator